MNPSVGSAASPPQHRDLRHPADPVTVGPLRSLRATRHLPPASPRRCRHHCAEPPVVLAALLLIAILVGACEPERFTDPEPVRVLEQEDVKHWVGRRVDDPTALDKTAWEVDNAILRARVDTPLDRAARHVVFRVKSANPEGAWPRAVAWARWGSEPAERAELWLVPGFLNPPGVYRDGILDLAPPPGAVLRLGVDLQLFGYHQFWIDKITVLDGAGAEIAVVEAEDARSHVGPVLTDPDASGRRARTDDHTLTYGPYVTLGPPGRYLAIFRLKAARGLPPGLLASVDVWAHDGRWGDGTVREKFYAREDLDGADFTNKGSWEEFLYDFDYDGAELVEFRVFTYNFQPGVLSFDRVEVYRLDDAPA